MFKKFLIPFVFIVLAIGFAGCGEATPGEADTTPVGEEKITPSDEESKASGSRTDVSTGP